MGLSAFFAGPLGCLTDATLQPSVNFVPFSFYLCGVEGSVSMRQWLDKLHSSISASAAGGISYRCGNASEGPRKKRELDGTLLIPHLRRADDGRLGVCRQASCA